MSEKKPKTIQKIMISGYYGFRNAGDEAILQSVIEFLKNRLPFAKIIVLSHNPLQTSQTYGVQAINRLNLFQILYRLKNTDLFISGGGGLLQDATGKGWSVLYYLGLIWGALFWKVPVFIYGQGIGPVHKKINRLLIKYTLNKVTFITLRENFSKILLNSLGVKVPPIYVYSDPSFLLQKKNTERLNILFTELKGSDTINRRRLIGFSLRETKNYGLNDQQDMARIADNLIENYQAKIIFLPFKREEDTIFSSRIIERMHNQQDVKIIKEDLSPEEWLSVISQLSLVIGMRLHSIIFSCRVMTPFIALNYDPKVSYFVEDLGLSNLLIDYSHISFLEIKKRLEYILENRKEIEKILTCKNKELEEKARENNQILFNFLKFQGKIT